MLIAESIGRNVFTHLPERDIQTKLKCILQRLHRYKAVTILALRKLPSHIFSVVILMNSRPVCTALAAPKSSKCRLEFQAYMPKHVHRVHLVWVPGHAGITLNELADALASGPVLMVLNPSSFKVIARSGKFHLRHDNAKSFVQTVTTFGTFDILGQALVRQKEIRSFIKQVTQQGATTKFLRAEIQFRCIAPKLVL